MNDKAKTFIGNVLELLIKYLIFIFVIALLAIAYKAINEKASEFKDSHITIIYDNQDTLYNFNNQH